MADSNISFVLDLDGNEFTQGISEAVSSVEHLISVTKQAGIAAGVVATAYLAVKSSLELTLEAENIKAINDQFERLSKNAGIASDTLKQGLMDVANGLVDDTDLLKAANRSIIEMGGSAKALPELFNVAKLATSAFGGDLLQNFESINQAIATGSVRGLKNLGIIVDQEKALREYAKAHGVVVSALSDAEQKQALLNAVLEKGKTAFAGVNPQIKETHNLIQQTKVALGQIGEAFTLAFDKKAGPVVTGLVRWFKEAADAAKTVAQAKFGEGSEQAAARVELLKKQLSDLYPEIRRVEKSMTDHADTMNRFSKANAAAYLDELKQKYNDLSTEMSKQQAIVDQAKPAEAKAQEGAGGVAPDNEKRLAAEAKFNQDLLGLKQMRIDAELANATTFQQVEELGLQRMLIVESQAEAEKESIRSQYRLGNIASQEQASQLIEEIEARKNAKLKAMEDELLAYRIKAADANLQKEASAGAALESMAAKASQAWIKSGGAAGIATTAFVQSSMRGFESLGRIAAGAAEDVDKVILSMVADTARAMGQQLFLLGLSPLPFPFGAAPWGMPVGAALLALSGALGGKGGTPSASGVGGGGGSSQVGGTTPSAIGAEVTTNDRPEMAQARENKSVTLQIMGNYFETEQTKTRLVEMIREASDATDFKISEIGV